MNNKKGMAGAIVGLTVGLVIAVVLMIGVLVPVLTSVVANQGFSGVNKTIGDNLTTFVLIGVLVLIAGVALYGLGKQ